MITTRSKKNIIEMPESRSAGVYAIINKTAHKCYIGSCQDLRNRASTHLSMLKHGKHHSKEMQEDYNNNHKFEFVVLRETRQEQWYDDDRKCLEDYFISCMKARDIELYNSPNHGIYEKNFFHRASWLDKRVIGLRNKVLFEK